MIKIIVLIEQDPRRRNNVGVIGSYFAGCSRWKVYGFFSNQEENINNKEHS